MRTQLLLCPELVGVSIGTHPWSIEVPAMYFPDSLGVKLLQRDFWSFSASGAEQIGSRPCFNKWNAPSHKLGAVQIPHPRSPRILQLHPGNPRSPQSDPKRKQLERCCKRHGGHPLSPSPWAPGEVRISSHSLSLLTSGLPSARSGPLGMKVVSTKTPPGLRARRRQSPGLARFVGDRESRELDAICNQALRLGRLRRRQAPGLASAEDAQPQLSSRMCPRRPGLAPAVNGSTFHSMGRAAQEMLGRLASCNYGSAARHFAGSTYGYHVRISRAPPA